MKVRAAPFLVCALAMLVPSPAAWAQSEQMSPASKGPMPCVEVRIGQDSAGRIDCLNRALRSEVEKAAPTFAGNPASRKSPDQLGQPTPAALKQRYGNAYGHSLVPQRPTQTFAPVLAPTR
jgi:hypothetical protein